MYIDHVLYHTDKLKCDRLGAELMKNNDVFFQHIVLALKLLVAYAIPDIPQQVAEEKARLEFLRREALKVRYFMNESFDCQIVDCVEFYLSLNIVPLTLQRKCV